MSYTVISNENYTRGITKLISWLAGKEKIYVEYVHSFLHSHHSHAGTTYNIAPAFESVSSEKRCNQCDQLRCKGINKILMGFIELTKPWCVWYSGTWSSQDLIWWRPNLSSVTNRYACTHMIALMSYLRISLTCEHFECLESVCITLRPTTEIPSK